MGCKTSKDTQEPSEKRPIKKGDQSQSAEKSPSKQDRKQIAEKELLKHKVTDILGFIKSGNLNMVAGLVDHHHLGQSVLLLRGFQEEIALYKGGEKLKTDQWSPLLLAVAFKRLTIVRYFLEELKISVRHAARPVPEGRAFSSRQEIAEF